MALKTFTTADGSANQALVTNGSGVLSFAAISADYVLLATTDASAQASVSFDGYFSSTYKNYQIIISNSYPASNNAVLYARYRRSNADVTASNYINGMAYAEQQNGSNSVAVEGNWNANFIRFAKDGTSNTATNGGFNAFINIHNPLSTNSYKYITYNFALLNAAPTIFFSGSAGVVLTDSTAALSGITFYYSSGNITAGSFKLYGIK